MQAARRGLAAAGTPPLIACLSETRTVLKLAGPDLLHFLQGLVTNDVSALEPPGAPPLFACVLSPQGRFLHDVVLHRAPGAAPAALADVGAARAPALLALLRRYRLRQRVEIDDAGGELRVWARWGDEAGTEGAAATEAASSGDGAAWPVDPRLAALGRRGLAPAGWAPAAPAAPAAAYRAARLRLGVAEGGAEVPPGEAVALEYNIDGLHGISFTKGCYVGQELMARTHFKGVVRKRLMPVEVDLAAAAAASAPPPAAGDDVFDAPGGAGRPVGRLRTVEGGAGAALLRLAPALAAAAKARPLFAAGGAPLRPRRPDWWPPHWGREEA